MQSVGLIGVGMIGLPMAQNILKGGFPLTAYDLDPGGSLKDQRLALAMAEACGLEAPGGRTVHEFLRQTAEKYPTDDFCSLVRLREEQAGIEVRLGPRSA